MPLISKKLAQELKEKDFRDAYVRAQTNAKVIQQLRALRRQNGITQAQLAAETGTTQSVIARSESVDYEGWGVSTLLRIAAAHDVALLVEFVAHDEFLRRTKTLAPHALEVESFNPERVDSLAQDSATVLPPSTPALRGLTLTYVRQGAPMSQPVPALPELYGGATPPSNAMNPQKQDDEREHPYSAQSSPAAGLAALA